MFIERRQSKRRAISRHAKIQLPGSTLARDCLVTDISDGGVRLHVAGVAVPDQFVLLLPESEISSRPIDCSVVWRLGYELGAKFINVASAAREAPNESAAKDPAIA
jgi:PilZ domain